ncbi:unnamed protein product, partial [Ixodes hexagonus]
MYYINIMDTVMTLIVPFLLLTVMNFMIARAIYLFYARHRQQRSFCSEGHVSSSFASKYIEPIAPSRQAGSLFNGPRTSVHPPGVVAHATQISVTRMLLVVSTVFILLNLPSYVMRICVFLLDAETLEASGSLVYILQRYFMLLYYTNFAVNFVLYNASSRMFRVTLCGYVQ